MINKILAVVEGGGGSGGVGGNPEINNPALGPRLQGKTGIQFFQALIPNLITLGLIIGTVIFLFIIIIGAIQWISSGEDKNALEEAKHKITNAVVGIIILFAVFAILKVIENFFGISILALDIGSLVIQ